jgi:hypothetical protein
MSQVVMQVNFHMTWHEIVKGTAEQVKDPEILKCLQTLF